MSKSYGLPADANNSLEAEHRRGLIAPSGAPPLFYNYKSAIIYVPYTEEISTDWIQLMQGASSVFLILAFICALAGLVRVKFGPSLGRTFSVFVLLALTAALLLLSTLTAS